ncbi:MAG: hypothetical protein HZB71_05225 [Betaproteobacteria bacterium]|nr:hypothetical protein [Betaproteobacteria bacterium]
MRIDSLSYFSTSLSGIQNTQSQIARLNQQLVSGNKVLAPKDDPLVTTRAMALSDRLAMRGQYIANQERATLTLNFESTVLQGIRTTLTQAVKIFSATGQEAGATDRPANTQLLRGVFDQLVALANSRDSEGNFIFSGDKTTTSPFANAGGGNFGVTPADGVATTFGGSTNLREVEVDSGHRVQVMDNLNTVFQAGAAGADLLQTLDEAITRLPLAAGHASAVNDQATLVGFQQVVDTALSNLSLLEQRVGSTLKELQDLKKTSQSLQLLEQDSLSGLTEVDQAAAIIELQSRQTVLQAASQAYAKTASLSLFNYLG